MKLTLNDNHILILNKIDKIKDESRFNLLKKNFPNAIYISAKNKRGLKKLLKLTDTIYKESLRDLDTSLRDLDTSIINKILKSALYNQQPAMSGRFRPKLRYAHSGGKNPPRIIIHGNNLKKIQDSYTRYLENYFRNELELGSTPLEVVYKDQANPFNNKPNQLNERQLKKRKRMIKRRKK